MNPTQPNTGGAAPDTVSGDLDILTERDHRTARHVPSHSRVLVIGENPSLQHLLERDKSCQVRSIPAPPLDIANIPATHDFDSVVIGWDAIAEGAPHELLIGCRRALSRDGSLLIVAANAAFRSMSDQDTESATSKRHLFRSIHDAGLLVVESEGIGDEHASTAPPFKAGVLLSKNATETREEMIEDIGVHTYIVHTIPIKSHRHHQLLRLKEVHVDRELIRLNAEVRRQRTEVKSLKEQQHQFIREVRAALQLSDDKARFFRTEIEEGLLLLAHRIKTEVAAPVADQQNPPVPVKDPPLTSQSVFERITGWTRKSNEARR